MSNPDSLTAPVLLTDPLSGAVFQWPTRPSEVPPSGAADLQEVLDLWGQVYRLPASALAPYRLSTAEAEAAAAQLLGDPDYLAHLVRELNLGDLGDLLSARTPEAFAAALGADQQNLAAAEARLSALEVHLAQAQDALTAAPAPVQTGLPSWPTDPKQHPAMLALLSLLSWVSPQWIQGTLAGQSLTPVTPLAVPLPALPSFDYAELLGRPLEPAVKPALEPEHEG